MYRIFLFFFFVIFNFFSFSQHFNPFHFVQQARIQSKFLNEERLLNLYFPSGYLSDSTASYPVIYLLDGSTHEDLLHVIGLVQFYTMTQQMPECIVVGISNVDRKRDFTYPTQIEQDKIDFPTTGGSAAFISFLEDELKPWVDSTLNSNGKSMLIGQSLGGLLATEVFLNHSALFNQYLIVSPSLWWDDESLLENALEKVKQMNQDSMQVFIAVGSEGPTMENDARDLNAVIELSNNPKIQHHFLFLEDEDHATILHEAIYRGFRAFFKKEEN
jgi:uncharacterized protein